MKHIFTIIAALTLLAFDSYGQSNIRNLYQLNDTKNVRNANDGESLVWSAIDGRWIPQLIGGGGGSQTPWVSNINGGGFDLSGVDSLYVDDLSVTNGLSFIGNGFSLTNVAETISIRGDGNNILSLYADAEIQFDIGSALFAFGNDGTFTSDSDITSNGAIYTSGIIGTTSGGLAIVAAAGLNQITLNGTTVNVVGDLDVQGAGGVTITGALTTEGSSQLGNTSADSHFITGSLYLGNGATSSGIIRISEDTDAGANYASFQVPALAANTVYVLPADDGDAGEQLQTDGAGNLTWEAAGSGGGGSVATDTIWNVAGDTVYGTGSDTASRLAIGTAGQFYQVNAGATAPQWSSFSGDALVATGGAITIQANSVALGTDTTGFYALGDSEGGAASTVVTVDGTDATSFVAIFDAATGNQAAKTDGGLLYDASTGTLQATILKGGAAGSSVGTIVMPDLDASHSLTLKAPDIIGTNVTFLLPGTNGVAGQVLKHAVTGQLYWADDNNSGAATAINDLADATGSDGVTVGASQLTWTWNGSGNIGLALDNSLAAEDNEFLLFRLAVTDSDDPFSVYAAFYDTISGTPELDFQFRANGATFNESVTMGSAKTFDASAGSLIGTDEAYTRAGWDGDTQAAQRDDISDQLAIGDADGDGKIDVLDQVAGIANTDINGAIQTPITTLSGLDTAITDATLARTDAAQTFTGTQTITQIDMGNTDTSITRSAAGVIAVEGVDVATISTKTGVHATPSTTNPLSPTWTSETHVVWYGATGTINLPAASGYTGKGIIIYNTGTFTVTIDPNGSEVVVRDGTPQTGGFNFTLSSGAGNYVALICDGARWITLGYKGTLTGGS